MAQAFDGFALLGREHVRDDFLDAELARDRFGRTSVIAGQHDHAQPFLTQLLERAPCGFLERVRHDDKACDRAFDRDEDHRLADRSPLCRHLRQRSRIEAPIREQLLIAHDHLPAFDNASHTLARHGAEVRDVRRRKPALLGCRKDGRGQRVLTRLFERRCKTEDFVLAVTRGGVYRDEARLALGEGARLVDDERVHLGQPLQCLGVLDEDPELRAAPARHHDRHRRRQAKRTRTSDDEHRNGIHQRMRQSRLRPPQRPRGKRHHSNGDDRRNEVGSHLICKPLDGRAAALRLTHRAHDLREQGVATDAGCADDERSGTVHRSARDLAAGMFLDGDRLAREHGLIDGALALDDLAIHRQLFAGPHAQSFPDVDVLNRNIRFRAIGLDTSSSLGCQAEQRPNRARGRLTRTQLQHLTEQHERHDDARGLEIKRQSPAVTPKGRGQRARKQLGDHAEQVSGAGAERDQGEHIEAAVCDGLHTAHEERPASPQNDRRGQRELNPPRQAGAERVLHRHPWKHLGHGEKQQRHR